MAVQGHRRKGAVVAGALAGSLALGLLAVSGCAGRGPGGGPAGDAAHGRGSSQVRQVREAAGPAADPVRALAAVRHAPAALARAGGARVRTSMETVSGGTRLTIRGRGVYDFARPVGRLTVMLPEGAAGRAGHRPITEVFSPGALYMKNRGAGVPAGKWVRLDTGALADGDLLTSGATDPLAAAELLGGAREVAYAGEERIEGVRVAHYWGTVDLSRAAQAAPERDRAALAAAAKGFSSGTVGFDAYLDEQGRPRVLRYRFGMAEAAAAGGGGAPTGAGRRPVTTAAAPAAVAPSGASAPAASVASVGEGVAKARPSGLPSPMTVVSTVELFSFGLRPDIALPAPAEIYAGTVASPQK
ncbi:hypothetical protein AB0K89_27845 [Streptomyces cinnamoneus]|uniref:hypothetical protein n=1 Tax=Streptomyces cinnamoneus TaxID=53446 RepID=UPI003444980B